MIKFYISGFLLLLSVYSAEILLNKENTSDKETFFFMFEYKS